MTIKEQTPYRQMFKRDWTMSSDYSTLNNEHSWEDQHIQLQNQQICTLDDYNYIMGSPIFVDAFL